jgi:hypothetical protein
VGLSLGASGLASSALASFGQPVNLQINGTVAANQLTVAVKGVNGSDPSPSNPVLVGFRDASSTGTVVAGSLQSALSFTLATTSSMGCTTAVTCRLWVELICQTISSGSCTSILVGLSVQSNANACFALNEAALQATGPGTGGGTSVGIIQTSVASLVSKPIRIIGYVEAIWTSGIGWATPSTVQILGPSVKKPCDVMQSVLTTTNQAPQLLTTTSYVATSLSASITPTSAANMIRVRADANITCGTAQGFLQIGRNSVSNLFGGQATPGSTNVQNFSSSLAGLDQPNTASSTNYTLYVKTTSVSNCTVNNITGGVMDMLIEEIMSQRNPTNVEMVT